MTFTNTVPIHVYELAYPAAKPPAIGQIYLMGLYVTYAAYGVWHARDFVGKRECRGDMAHWSFCDDSWYIWDPFTDRWIAAEPQIGSTIRALVWNELTQDVNQYLKLITDAPI